VLDDLALAGMLLTVKGLVEQTYGPNPMLLCPAQTAMRLHRWAHLTSIIEVRVFACLRGYHYHLQMLLWRQRKSLSFLTHAVQTVAYVSR
jgi:hypothetical protein